MRSWNAVTSFDVTVWGLVTILLLAAADIGFVSGDAVKHANAFAEGSWTLNPNHLLMEPIAAGWFHATTSLGWKVVGPDRLKGLSLMFGALSVVLFRGLVPSRVQASRSRANVATLVFCGCYAFLALWISGEPILLQMPALVLATVAALRYVSNPGAREAACLGTLFATAALFFISNAVVGVFVVIALLLWRLSAEARTSAIQEAGVMVAALIIVGCAGLIGGWFVAAPGPGFWDWVTSYAGNTRVSDSTVYGIQGGGIFAFATAAARSLYGAALALVDISPFTEALRGARSLDASAVISVLVLVIGFLVCALATKNTVGSKERPGTVALISGWVAGVLAFGFYFNNSDDQFFVQLAIPLALLATIAPFHKRRLRAIGPAVIGIALWNMTYIWSSFVKYPREERLAELSRAVEGARLVLYPGFDEPGRLMHLLPESFDGAWWSLMELSARYPVEKGLEVLTDSIEHVVAEGGEVRIINIFGAHSGLHPWTALKVKGYERQRVAQRLHEMRYPVVVKFECAFTVWTVGDNTGKPQEASCVSDS